MFVITHVHMYTRTRTASWLFGSKYHPVPLGLLMHTFLCLDIRITLDVASCLNAMADKESLGDRCGWLPLGSSRLLSVASPDR